MEYKWKFDVTMKSEPQLGKAEAASPTAADLIIGALSYADRPKLTEIKLQRFISETCKWHEYPKNDVDVLWQPEAAATFTKSQFKALAAAINDFFGAR